MGAIFQREAIKIAEWGLAVIPVDPHEKTPQIHWPERPLHPSSKYLDKLRDKFADSNIGVLTKPSNLTVVDIDDPSIVGMSIKRFGETPMIARSPSGGTHLYYRSNGEPCRNLRPSEGIAVDIKGAGSGKGGLIVAPPSQRLDGRSYEFIEGGWISIPDLPTIKFGSLPLKPDGGSCVSQKLEPLKISERPNVEPANDRGEVGQRNTSLFDYLRSTAAEVSSLDDLVGLAVLRNADFDAPLEYPEVATVAGNVWKMKIDGRLLVKGKPGSIIPHDMLGGFCGNGDAALLLLHLLRDHGSRKDPFFLHIPLMVQSNYIVGWSKYRYVCARDVLLASGMIACIHHGGRHKGDSSLFRLCA